MQFANNLFVIITTLFNLYMFIRWDRRKTYDQVFSMFLFCLTVFGIILTLKNLSII